MNTSPPRPLILLTVPSISLSPRPVSRRMLEDTSFADVVSWGPQGDCFVVKDMNEFTKSILPRMFKHSNFASFVRQLNKYDFHKVRTGFLTSVDPPPSVVRERATLAAYKCVRRATTYMRACPLLRP